MPRLLIPKMLNSANYDDPKSYHYLDLSLQCWPANPLAILSKFPTYGDYYTVATAIKRAGPYGANHPVYARGIFTCALSGRRLGKKDD